MLPSEVTYDYFLTASETDAQGRMPMWLIVSRIIDVATNHANTLNIGYDTLDKLGISWVLTRLSIEMVSYPGINQPYSFTTWIEGYNRMYSDRCFEITDAEGNIYGYARSMWVAIDKEKRTMADLSQLDRSHFTISERRSPVSRQGKQKPLADDADESKYTFRFCDIDVNRHVNTVQYVRHILNQWPIEQFDRHQIARFDIAFHNECHYGETVKIRHADDPGQELSLCEIIDAQDRHAITCSIKWAENK